MGRSTYTPTDDRPRRGLRCPVCHVRTRYPATHVAYHAVLVPSLLPEDAQAHPNQEDYRAWAATVRADQQSHY